MRFLLKRLTQLSSVLLVMSLVVFSLTLLLPGDVTVTILGETASEAERAALREELGLNRPVIVQYVVWLGDVLRGDLGTSLKTGEPIADMLAARLPATVELTLLAVLVSLIVGVPLGVVAALNRNSWIDSAISALAMSSVAIPYFLFGILLIMLFSVTLRWLPPSGYVPFWVDPVGNLQTMIMPTLTLGLAQAALVTRQTRAALIGVMSQDFIRTARAKGASEGRVVALHALRHTMIAVLTVVSLQMGALIGGAVVTETIFSLPGLGRMVVDGTFERDFPVVQGAVLMVVVGVVSVNLLTDIGYLLLDRRIKS